MKTKITILYGSQTGTAQDIAERLTRQAIQLNLQPQIHPMNSLDPTSIDPEGFLVFVAATTGQGEEPDNMKNFWKLLCRKSCPPIFSDIKYCVLGLGDSSYAKYNFVAKKLHKRISQLGGISLLPLELADDQHDLGIDAVVPNWIRAVWKSVIGIQVENVTGIIGPKFKVISKSIVMNGNGHVGSVEETCEQVITPSGVRLNEVISTKRMTSEDHFQDVRFVQVSAANLNYEPGDVIAVLPTNSNENVDLFFQLFPTLNPNEEIELEPQYDWVQVPKHFQDILKPLTWQKIAQSYLDIQSVPSKSFFEYLRHFSEDETEKEKLTEFCTPEGQDDLYKYCFKPKRNILEVLLDFPKTTERIPRDYIFDLIPPIKCRSFSIASYSEHSVAILVAVVNYKTWLKKPRLGLCSNWLASLQVGDTVPCWITKGSFTFPPAHADVPLILVGPGTGCAPFNSLLAKRIPENSRNQFYLFFGCRSKAKDYFFQEEWTNYKTNGNLHLFLSFSRDEDYEFKYVQHQIQANSKLVFDLVCNKGAFVYVAGNAKNMPADVQSAFVAVLESGGVPDGREFIKSLVKKNRYQTEVWG